VERQADQHKHLRSDVYAQIMLELCLSPFVAVGLYLDRISDLTAVSVGQQSGSM
jgi:hypothetical protein